MADFWEKYWDNFLLRSPAYLRSEAQRNFKVITGRPEKFLTFGCHVCVSDHDAYGALTLQQRSQCCASPLDCKQTSAGLIIDHVTCDLSIVEMQRIFQNSESKEASGVIFSPPLAFDDRMEAVYYEADLVAVQHERTFSLYHDGTWIKDYDVARTVDLRTMRSIKVPEKLNVNMSRSGWFLRYRMSADYKADDLEKVRLLKVPGFAYGETEGSTYIPFDGRIYSSVYQLVEGVKTFRANLFRIFFGSVSQRICAEILENAHFAYPSFISDPGNVRVYAFAYALAVLQQASRRGLTAPTKADFDTLFVDSENRASIVEQCTEYMVAHNNFLEVVLQKTVDYEFQQFESEVLFASLEKVHDFAVFDETVYPSVETVVETPKVEIVVFNALSVQPLVNGAAKSKALQVLEELENPESFSDSDLPDMPLVEAIESDKKMFKSVVYSPPKYGGPMSAVRFTKQCHFSSGARLKRERISAIT